MIGSGKKAREMKKRDLEYEVKGENGKEKEVLTSIISGMVYEKGSRYVNFKIPSDAVPSISLK